MVVFEPARQLTAVILGTTSAGGLAKLGRQLPAICAFPLPRVRNHVAGQVVTMPDVRI